MAKVLGNANESVRVRARAGALRWAWAPVGEHGSGGSGVDNIERRVVFFKKIDMGSDAPNQRSDDPD